MSSNAPAPTIPTLEEADDDEDHISGSSYRDAGEGGGVGRVRGIAEERRVAARMVLEDVIRVVREGRKLQLTRCETVEREILLHRNQHGGAKVGAAVLRLLPECGEGRGGGGGMCCRSWLAVFEVGTCLWCALLCSRLWVLQGAVGVVVCVVVGVDVGDVVVVSAVVGVSVGVGVALGVVVLVDAHTHHPRCVTRQSGILAIWGCAM